MTGFDLSDLNNNPIDPWKYKEQMYGPLLTGPSKLNDELLKARKTKEYCTQDVTTIIKNE